MKHKHTFILFLIIALVSVSWSAALFAEEGQEAVEVQSTESQPAVEAVVVVEADAAIETQELTEAAFLDLSDLDMPSCFVNEDRPFLTDTIDLLGLAEGPGAWYPQKICSLDSCLPCTSASDCYLGRCRAEICL